MRDLLSRRSVLLAVLVSSVALARGSDDKGGIRTEKVSDHPGYPTSSVYVSGQVATVLRFEQDVDPTKTKLLAWEGRFEPLLVGSKKVVIEPLRNLDPDEVVPLLVTLVDGTEIPFIVKPRSFEEWGWTDHQVNVFKDPESYNAVLSSLNDSLKRERELQEKVERFEQEDSVDYALAACLARGAIRQTSFRELNKWVLNAEGADFTVRTFTGKGKAGVLFSIGNKNRDAAWKLKMARLYTARSWKDRPVAVRADHESIAKGTTGNVAVVVDKSAFVEGNGLEQLVLEIYRNDGYREVVVLLDPSLIRE